MRLLKPLSEDKPVIGVFHQPQLTAEFCTRVIAIKAGAVVYDGAPQLSPEDLAMIYESELEEVVSLSGQYADERADPPAYAMAARSKGAPTY